MPNTAAPPRPALGALLPFPFAFPTKPQLAQEPPPADLVHDSIEPWAGHLISLHRLRQFKKIEASVIHRGAAAKRGIRRRRTANALPPRSRSGWRACSSSAGWSAAFGTAWLRSCCRSQSPSLRLVATHTLGRAGSRGVRRGTWYRPDQPQPRGGLGCAGDSCLLYTSPSPRDQRGSRMPSSA